MVQNVGENMKLAYDFMNKIMASFNYLKSIMTLKNEWNTCDYTLSRA